MTQFNSGIETKIKNSIENVEQAIRRSMYIDPDSEKHVWVYSYDKEFKIFVELPDNLYSWEIFKEFQRRLLEKGISSEVCMANRASDKHVIVWKSKREKGVS